MPTYEYACRDCGEHLEVVQSFKDQPLTVCGSCGGALRKVFSAAGIIFKGSGYYVTDTRGKGAKRSTAASTAGDGETSGSGSSSGSDSAGSSEKTGSSDKSTTSTSGDSGSSSEAKSA